VDVDEKLKAARERVKELELARETFRRNANSGAEVPGESPDATTQN